MDGRRPGLLLPDRQTVVGVALMLAAVVFAARLAVDDPEEPIMFLLVVPVVLIAVELGLVGGFVAASVASMAVIVWDLTADADLTLYGLIARSTIFMLCGLTVGSLASARNDLQQRLREHAQKDELTGVSNRRHFEEQARRQLDFIRRYGHGGALFLLDVDRLKGINDSLGHRAGDDALARLGTAIKKRLRTSDVVGRIGGDEFAMLLPETGRKEAELIATALLDLVGNERVGTDGTKLGCSLGIVAFSAAEDLELGNLLHAADQAMYAAKRAGGLRFSFAQGPSYTDGAPSEEAAASPTGAY
jgi:diguanylate cyclase (GGDEF)-like protein